MKDIDDSIREEIEGSAQETEEVHEDNPEWDGSESELVADDDAEEYEIPETGIKISYIMTYDEEGSATFDSKEFYIKKASEYFAELPAKNTPASAIVRKVFAESRGFWGSQNDYALLLGYVDSLNRMHLFSGEQMSRPVTLRPEDKLIIYSNH